MGKRIYKFNENFLDILDTPEKAYFLGFMYSDGNIYLGDYSEYVKFGQMEDSKDIVYKINDLLESEYPVYQSIKENGKVYYHVQLISTKMYNDLYRLGCTDNKSLTLLFPTNIPDELMPHFIRGLFDGDGCVWSGKRKVMKVKDSSKPSGYRERIIHNVKFTYTGNFSFVDALLDFLIKKLGFKKTKLNFSKAKNPNNNTSESVCTMEYSGRGQLKKFYDYIYKDASIYIDCKKLKFEEIFCALDEKSSKDTSLIAGTPEMAISSQASDNISVEGSSTIPEMGVESSDSKCEAPNK